MMYYNSEVTQEVPKQQTTFNALLLEKLITHKIFQSDPHSGISMTWWYHFFRTTELSVQPPYPRLQVYIHMLINRVCKY